MKQISEIVKKTRPGSFLNKMFEGLQDADADHHDSYCPICGELKKEFLDPKSGRLFGPLQCACERHYAMLKDVWQINLEIYGAEFTAWLNGAKLSGNETQIIYKTHHFPAMKDLRDEIEETKQKINLVKRGIKS